MMDKNKEMAYHQKLMIHIKSEMGARFWTESDFYSLGSITSAKVIKKDGKITSPNIGYGSVVFKNLEAGDIIQLEGKSSGGGGSGDFSEEMYEIIGLSYEAPVYKSNIEVIAPIEKRLYFQTYRTNVTPNVTEIEGYKRYHWMINDLPKIQTEEAIQNPIDQSAWMMLSTQKDWAKVVDWYQQKTYRRLESNYEIDETLAAIIKPNMTEKEKVETIYNYITEEITYSFVSFLNSSYIPRKPSETISSKIGDCKDVASLMITMLREVGIEAYYVLARSGGFTNEKPVVSHGVFNHAIVAYELSDGVPKYLDLTTDFYPHHVLPEFNADGWALRIKDGETDIFQLPDDRLNPAKSTFKIKMEGEINSDRSLEMKVDYTASGVLSGTFREYINRLSTTEEKKKYLIEYFGETAFDHLQLKDFQFENLADIATPLKGKLTMKSYNHVEKVSDFFIMQIPVLQGVQTQPALFAETRSNNLNLAELFEITPTFQELKLRIPKDFQLMELPEDISIDNEFGKYVLNFKRTPEGVLIRRKMQFKKRTIFYEEYKDFKAFYLKVLDADRTKLAVFNERT